MPIGVFVFGGQVGPGVTRPRVLFAKGVELGALELGKLEEEIDL